MTVEWNPDCVAGDNPSGLADVDSPALRQLESEVFEYLKNSWCSEQKARLLLELVVITKPSVCVEVGAFTGSTTLPVLAGLRYLGAGRAYVVDPWSTEEAIRGLPAGDVNTVWWSGLDMQAVRARFAQMLETWRLDSWCEVLPEASRQAVSQVPATDLLHLDGNFSDEGSLLDSELYLPKVTPGGYVVLSNVLVTVAGRPTKMRALWPLFDRCEVVSELDGGNTLLFRKRWQ